MWYYETVADHSRRRTLKSTLRPTIFFEMVKFVVLGVHYLSLVFPVYATWRRSRPLPGPLAILRSLGRISRITCCHYVLKIKIMYSYKIVQNQLYRDWDSITEFRVCPNGAFELARYVMRHFVHKLAPRNQQQKCGSTPLVHFVVVRPVSRQFAGGRPQFSLGSWESFPAE